ncbi:MAG: NADPH-dependent F420 reductase [Acidimicrobiales bacterium]
MHIGLLGGTGPAGRALAARLASLDYQVTIGSRSRYRAMEIRDTIVERWPDRHLKIEAAENEVAADAEVIVIATPWDGAAETALRVKDQLAGKVVISMANALARVGGEFQPLVPPRGSVAASVQAAVPRSLVAAAMHHLPAKELGAIDRPIDSDVLICSDHPEATEVTTQIVGSIPGLRPLDAGELSNATPIEAFTAVLLQLNVRYKTRVAVKLTGIADDQAPTAAMPGASDDGEQG